MIKLRSWLLASFFLLHLSVAYAARIDTVAVYSDAMQKEIPAIVVTPDTYQNSEQSFPVIYLLHGYSDSYSGWVTKATSIPALANQHQVIVVLPDGGYNSWYLNSPKDQDSQYETHIAEEVVKYVDTNYRTIAKANSRAITGLSMGGHGGLFLGIRHQDTFGAAGSMSGGVDLTYNIQGWELPEKLGSYASNPTLWDSLSVVNMVEKIDPEQLKIIVDCGTDDFFFEINRKLHRKLLEADIPHDYIERPGSHNWTYWDNAVQYQFLFFSNFFKSKRQDS